MSAQVDDPLTRAESVRRWWAMTPVSLPMALQRERGVGRAP